MDIGWSLCTRTDTVQQTITEQLLDVFALMETWHNDHDNVCLHLSTPAGYAVVDTALRSGRGGGVAIIFCQHLKWSMVSLPACRTMELICMQHITASGPAVILNIYRPPPSSEWPSSLFFDELRTVLKTLVIFSCPVVVDGDFNLLVQRCGDSLSQQSTVVI